MFNRRRGRVVHRGPLDDLEIAEPCDESWESMTPVTEPAPTSIYSGETRRPLPPDAVRRCAKCALNVYDLESMSRSEAEDLVRRTEGRLCVQLFRRADGKVVTRDDCQEGK